MSKLGKGKPASKGTASGIARFVMSTHDIEYQSTFFQEGDILIAPMTDIDYLPLMRKATAVLTSLGGKFCHAAIICQQLNKPCVVGFKHTSVQNKLEALRGKNITVNGTTGDITLVEE